MSAPRRRRRALLPGVLALATSLLTGLAVGVAPTAAHADSVTGPARFVPLTPTRVLDTREGLGAPRGVVAPRGSVDLDVLGAGGVPTEGVSAVVLNVTITGTSGTGYVQAYPTGQVIPGEYSNINHTDLTRTIAGLVTAPVGDDGQVSLFTEKGGHLLADVFGYYQAATSSRSGRFVPLAPQRILDTRQVGARPAAETTVPLQVTGAGGVPATGVSAVALNVTATQPARAGYVQVVPTGGATPLGASSNLNVTAAGQSIANLVIVPVGEGGRVTLFTSHGSHMIADVAGYYTDASAPIGTGGLLQALHPVRPLDTRDQHAGGYTGPKPADEAAVVLGTPQLVDRGLPETGVSGLVLNVAAVGPAAPGFVQVLPTGGAAHGSSSNLNYSRGQVIANAALVPLGANGSVTLYTSRSTHLLADVFGYFLSERITPPVDGGAGDGGGAGGDGDSLEQLVVAPAVTEPFDRSSWGGWSQQPNGCDTESVVLTRDSEEAVGLEPDGCTVVEGMWTDSWTAFDLPWFSPDDLVVHHLVPVAVAHASGGHAWDAARKQAFVNDLAGPQLRVVSKAVDQAKAGRGPDQWKPASASNWCSYADEWVTVKRTWDLTVTTAEKTALREMLDRC